MTIPVFDGHNDFLLRLFRQPHRRRQLWCERNAAGHIDLPRLVESGYAGGMFAVFVPSGGLRHGPDRTGAFDVPAYDVPSAARVCRNVALRAAVAMAGHLAWMERASDRKFRICRTAAELRDTQRCGRIGGVLHLEGAEAIDDDFLALDVLSTMGLKSLGLVWSRPNAFGHGVPFRYPSAPDIGPGLTEAGKRLVSECNRRRIVVDVSHLNEAGFNDVAKLSDAPLVASHSCAHAVSQSSRNLTDRQLAMIAESGGLVGLNFATILLRRDGRRSPVTGWSALLRHIDHLIGILGEDHVGFGSDFDGTAVPDVIGDVTGLSRVLQALRRHGFDDRVLRRMCHENWHAVLERTWGD
jgi:membrane dipeptidase